MVNCACHVFDCGATFVVRFIGYANFFTSVISISKEMFIGKHNVLWLCRDCLGVETWLLHSDHWQDSALTLLNRDAHASVRRQEQLQDIQINYYGYKIQLQGIIVNKGCKEMKINTHGTLRPRVLRHLHDINSSQRGAGGGNESNCVQQLMEMKDTCWPKSCRRTPEGTAARSAREPPLVDAQKFMVLCLVGHRC